MAVQAMSGRAYLSIGDVLSLLREEFPDVTISKIRFLESQGLVDPERSPSGYRKFYEEDVARLRWVLRKQRDHFLPLKVIRDRLAAAGSGVPPDDEPVPDGAAAAEGSPASSPAEAAQGAPGAAATDARPTADGDGSVPGGPGGNGTDAPDATAGHRATPERVGAERPAAERAGAMAGAQLGSPPAPAGPSTLSAAAGPAALPAPGVPGGVAAGRHVAGGGSAGTALSPSVSGVSLTLGELCAATGLGPDVVASLESLGLLAPMAIAGGTYYDEEALTVAKLVVEFGRYGIEPRHLRMYRNAADREVGLVEQVVTPLLRQRNPEARQRAVEAASELARLGQSMRASLVRAALRRQLGT